MTRYNTDHLSESQFEPGSRGRVLKNLLAIRSKRAMDEMEATKLAEVTDWAIRHVTAGQCFTAADIGQRNGAMIVSRSRYYLEQTLCELNAR